MYISMTHVYMYIYMHVYMIINVQESSSTAVLCAFRTCTACMIMLKIYICIIYMHYTHIVSVSMANQMFL